jgi:RHS repeat-associated protein
LLRIDEKYDSDNDDVIESSDLWRVMNWYVHGPGSIGQTVRATAYSYNHNKTNSPCQTDEYYYCYDALGNVNGVLQDGTYYRWEMDAFGNDLPGGNDFLPMTSEGPKEHQTGQMYDTSTGFYHFHHRWYDVQSGRFVSAEPLRIPDWQGGVYGMSSDSPLRWADPTGLEAAPPEMGLESLTDHIYLPRSMLNKASHEFPSIECCPQSYRYSCIAKKTGPDTNVELVDVAKAAKIEDLLSVLTKGWLTWSITVNVQLGSWKAQCYEDKTGDFCWGDVIYNVGGLSWVYGEAKGTVQIPTPGGNIELAERCIRKYWPTGDIWNTGGWLWKSTCTVGFPDCE